jgi:hypothetical protein
MTIRQGNPQRLQVSFGFRHELILIPEDKLDRRALHMRMMPENKLLEMQIIVPTRDGIGTENWTPILSDQDLYNFLAGLSKLVSEQRLITLAVEVEHQLHKWKFKHQPFSVSPPLRAAS